MNEGKRMKIKILLSIVLAAAVLFTGCMKNSTMNKSDEKGTNAVAENNTTSDDNEETSLSEEEIMNEVWEPCYQNGFGDLLYPEFTLGWGLIESKYARTYTNEETGICVTERDNTVKISNDSKTVSASLYAGICNDRQVSKMCERLFVMDLTGDGVKELIFKLDVAEMNAHMTYLYVFDTKTLEQISIADGMGALLEGYFKDYEAANITESGFDLVVTDKNGDTVTDHSEQNITGCTQMTWYVHDEPTAIVVKDGNIYLRQYGEYIDVSDNNYMPCASVCVEQKLEYSEETGKFEAVSLPILLAGEDAETDQPIYPENFQKAMDKFEKYNNREK